jgi:hypothetical protein
MLHLLTEYTECQAFFQSSELGPPTPLTNKRMLLLPLWVQGADTLACGGGDEVRGGEPNFDEGTDDTLVLYVLYCPSTDLLQYLLE